MKTIAFVLLLAATALHSQEFEVASIKPNRGAIGANISQIEADGQRFTASNVSLKVLVMIAYEVNDRQVNGVPAWLNSEPYDVDAKVERPADPHAIHIMLQALLADRFGLKLHKETKEVPLYVLTAEHCGSHLHENTSGGEPRVTRGSAGKPFLKMRPWRN